EPSQQWASQENGRADSGAECRVERLGLEPSRVHPDGVGSGPLGPRAEVHQYGQHGFDIPDARNVLQLHGTVGEDAGGENGQSGVLIARGMHGSAKWTPTADQ